MEMSFKWRNPSWFLRKMRKEGEVNVPEKVEKALKIGAEVIVADAKRRTPVDTGLLRNNVNVTIYDVTPDGGKINIAYLQEYAPYVHERLELTHPVGEAKFLENALKSQEVKTKIFGIIKAQMGY